MGLILKCRKCRRELTREEGCNSVVITAHGDKQSSIDQDQDSECSNVDQDLLWFLEESSTPWISDVVAKAEWTKGKLNCPNCGARIGSFDFTSRSKCACGSTLLPAVHLVKSKVDSFLDDSNLLATLRN